MVKYDSIDQFPLGSIISLHEWMNNRRTTIVSENGNGGLVASKGIGRRKGNGRGAGGGRSYSIGVANTQTSVAQEVENTQTSVAQEIANGVGTSSIGGLVVDSLATRAGLIGIRDGRIGGLLGRGFEHNGVGTSGMGGSVADSLSTKARLVGTRGGRRGPISIGARGGLLGKGPASVGGPNK
ncbi:uncharacterized protein LOC132295284 [Cornus florida]|uniref:uncharacterized protein LOC132295284 n=1 Tax=Cornus florida TaxID=4283 RepID=UPI0028A1198B|nr:uncharacterized protein LOC132295284 [Cornus florida]